MIDNIIEEQQWIIKKSIEEGIFKKYQQAYDNCQSCKPYINQEDKYNDCMIQKMNYALEKAIYEAKYS